MAEHQFGLTNYEEGPMGVTFGDYSTEGDLLRFIGALEFALGVEFADVEITEVGGRLVGEFGVIYEEDLNIPNIEVIPQKQGQFHSAVYIFKY